MPNKGRPAFPFGGWMAQCGAGHSGGIFAGAGCVASSGIGNGFIAPTSYALSSSLPNCDPLFAQPSPCASHPPSHQLNHR